MKTIPLPILSTCETLVIGSGLAGLYCALRLARSGQRVILITKHLMAGSASHLAQGGIAAVTDFSLDQENGKYDSVEQHISDTLHAGADLNRPDIVRKVVLAAQNCIEDLIAFGVPFTKNNDDADNHNATGNNAIGNSHPDTKSTRRHSHSYHLHKEGGHSFHRIWNTGDSTGEKAVQALIHQLKQHPQVHIMEATEAIDLIVEANQCLGAIVGQIHPEQIHPEQEAPLLEALSSETPSSETLTFNGLFNTSPYAHYKQLGVIYATQTVLATGGASNVFLHSTNPPEVNGDGMAMAWRAGCTMVNMEFEQFHPTAFYTNFHTKEPGQLFLITEALRGEGGILLSQGDRFMPRYDIRAELASRDIVTRAIVNEMKTTGLPFVELDVRSLGRDKLKRSFPVIFEHCLQYGVDISEQPIPVVPAAHYSCGGISIDEYGQTDIARLYAIGECAHSGLHGANRLASNSLLECIAFASFASDKIAKQSTPSDSPAFSSKSSNSASHTKQFINLQIGYHQHLWIATQLQTIRQLMWENAGITRNSQGLIYLIEQIQKINERLNGRFDSHLVHPQLQQLRNTLTVSEVIARSALFRKESRGGHYTTDFPHTNELKQDTFLSASSL